VVLLELKLDRVLDRDDALVARDEARQHVQQRRLARTRTSGHQDVQSGLDARSEKVRHVRRDRAEADQVVDAQRVPAELTDGQRGAVDRQRRDDGVDAGTVHESRVDERRRLVDAAADLADDAVDDPPQVRFVVERHRASRQLALLLDVDGVRPVDHDLGDRVVIEESLQGTQTENVVLDLADNAASLLGGERSRGFLDDRVELLADEATDQLLVECALIEPGTDPLEQLGGRLLLELADRIQSLSGRGNGVAALAKARSCYRGDWGSGQWGEGAHLCRPRRERRGCGIGGGVGGRGEGIHRLPTIGATSAETF